MNLSKLSMSKVAKELTSFFYKKREKEAMQWLVTVSMKLYFGECCV